MENLNTVNDVQSPVVAVEESALDNGGAECATAEVTDRPQSREENASFRKMRLENQRLREENDRLTGDILEQRMAEDLAQIRQLDESVGSLEELGEEFFALIASGISAPVAFSALRQAQQINRPPQMGALAGGAGGDKTYYSPSEVDALSSEQLSDPHIWQRVRESMTKWHKR